MAWTTIGINFRSTSGFVTDNANQTYCLAETTDQTRGGATFRWDANVTSKADRSTTPNVQLAGINYRTNNGTQATFSLDLPQLGWYIVRWAIGDYAGAQTHSYAKLLDGSTVLATLNDPGSTAAATRFYDMAGTLQVADTSKAFFGNQVEGLFQFTAGPAKIVIGTPTNTADVTALAHFYMSYLSIPAGGGASALVP